MKRRHNHVRSQWIAAGVSFAAVMVMLAPLRQGPAGMRTQHASFIPLLAASGVAETDAFRRLTTAAPQHALAAPQVRTPDRSVAAAPRAPSPVSGRLSHDFQAPRLRWHQLDADQRAALDALVTGLEKGCALMLHGSPAPNARELGRLHRLVRGQAAGLPYQVIIGDALETHAPANHDGMLHVCLLGDFDSAAPSARQLAMLDEVLDYLSMKLGPLPLRLHQADGTQGCLGRAFPTRELTEALSLR